ncbi:hypothetical protein B0H14DRAFT_977891 [Mycena olivaceomarginata]|nr:hypothetical protein B0H14DRAFT_977891 [Mycena olivaceomarginata]
MLRSLFSLFFPRKRRDDDKMARLIQTLRPTKTVKGLVVRSRLEMSTAEWVDILSDVESDEQRLLDLDRCFIDKVDYVRKDSKDAKDIHEKVGFTFHLASADESMVSTQVGREDYRAACVQRLTADHPSKPGRRMSADSENWTGSDSSTLDAVRIDADYREVELLKTKKGTTYTVLQTLTFPAGTPYSERLTALDCAILASVITQWAKDYSRLRHMCMWFATIFFLSAERICKQRHFPPMKVDGPSVRSAGKYGKLRIVDPKTGRLLFDRGNSLVLLKTTMRKGMLENGVARPEIEQFLDLLDIDNALWLRDEKEKGPDPVEEIVALFKARRHQIRERMVRDIEFVLLRTMAVERKAQAAVQAAEERTRAAEERMRAAEESMRVERDKRIAAENRAQAVEEELRAEREKRVVDI